MSRPAPPAEEERLQLVELLAALRRTDLLAGSTASEAFRHMMDSLDDQLEALERAAGCVAAAVRAGLLQLAELAAACEGGAHFPLFFIVLQRLSEQSESQQELSDQLASTKVSKHLAAGPRL